MLLNILGGDFHLNANALCCTLSGLSCHKCICELGSSMLIISFGVKSYQENRGDRLMMDDLASLQFLIVEEIDKPWERSPVGGNEIVAKGSVKKGLRVLYRCSTHNSAKSLINTEQGN